jgi:hypothetical protein
MVAGYSDAVLALNPTHYYPLNNTYGMQDVAGANISNPATTRGTNFVNLSHGVPASPTVTFDALGAHFNGTSNAWLTAASDRGMSVDNGTTNQLTIALWVQFTNYTQNDTGGNNLHWIAKGASNSSNFMEWAFRLYADSNAARARNVSGYYWNPSTSGSGGLGTPDGTTNSGGLGSGSYMAPPASEGGGTERHNGPAGSGLANSWHFFVVEFSKTTADATGSGTHGVCRMYYGNSGVAAALMNEQNMWSSAHINPRFTSGPFTVGSRRDNSTSWTLSGIVRRVAFFNSLLSPTDMNTMRTAHNTYGNTEGTAFDSVAPGPGGSFTPDSSLATSTTTGATDAGAWTKTLTVPALPANSVHFISCTLNAGTMDTAGGGIATPTGYTRLTPADPTYSGTSVAGTIVFYKLVTSAQAAGATAVLAATGTTATTGRFAVNDFVFPDVSAVTAGTYNTAAAATTLNTATITPTSGQKVVAFYGLKENTVSSNGITFSAPATGYSILKQCTSTSAVNTNAANAVVVEDAASTGSATGALALTSTDTGVWGVQTVRLTKVAVPAISTFTDPLTTFSSSVFSRTDSTAVAVTGGAVSITAPAGSTNALTGLTTYSIDESNVYGRVVHSPGTNSVATQFLVQDTADTTKDMGFRIFTDPGGVQTLQMGSRTSAVFDAGSTTIPYDGSTMAYLRIREAGTTVHFETSSNTTTWTDRATITSPGWVGNVATYWTAARSTGATGSMTPSSFSSINTAPSGDPTPSANVFPIQSLVDQFTSEDTTKWVFDGATSSGGSARLPATAVEAQIRSRDYWNLQNSTFELHVTPAAGGTSPVTAVIIQDSATVGTGIRVTFDGAGNATASLIASNAPIGSQFTFAFTSGQRLRIREGTYAGGTAGRLYVDTGVWDVNAQTFLWTQRTTTPFTSPAWVTSTRPILSAKNTSGSSSSALIDDVNAITPQGSPSGPPVSDTFEGATIDTVKWTAYGTPTQSGGVLTLDAAVEGIVSNGTVNLAGQKQYVQISDATTTVGQVAVFRLERDGTNHLQFRFEGGQVYAEYVVGGTKTTLGNVAFDPTNTRFVQIREAGGSIFWEYGSATTGMTQLGTALNPIAVSALKVRLERST